MSEGELLALLGEAAQASIEDFDVLRAAEETAADLEHRLRLTLIDAAYWTSTTGRSRLLVLDLVDGAGDVVDQMDTTKAFGRHPHAHVVHRSPRHPVTVR